MENLLLVAPEAPLYVVVVDTDQLSGTVPTVAGGASHRRYSRLHHLHKRCQRASAMVNNVILICVIFINHDNNSNNNEKIQAISDNCNDVVLNCVICTNNGKKQQQKPQLALTIVMTSSFSTASSVQTPENDKIKQLIATAPLSPASSV